MEEGYSGIGAQEIGWVEEQVLDLTRGVQEGVACGLDRRGQRQ